MTNINGYHSKFCFLLQICTGKNTIHQIKLISSKMSKMYSSFSFFPSPFYLWKKEKKNKCMIFWDWPIKFIYILSRGRNLEETTQHHQEKKVCIFYSANIILLSCILLCWLLQNRFSKSYYNVGLIGGKLLFIPQ